MEMDKTISQSQLEIDATEFEKARKRVYEAHDSLLIKLFGYIPGEPGNYTVSRSAYTKAMHEVQKETGLVEGDPDMILFVLEQLSRSPRFLDEEEVSEL